MDGKRKDDTDDQTVDQDSHEIPVFACARGRGRPPAKAFVSKPFSVRTLMRAGAKPSPGTLLARPHGTGPQVKWPTPKCGHHSVLTNQPTTEASAAGATGPASEASNRGELQTMPENMSERFITERLMSDRGSSSLGSQIPRREGEIPNTGTGRRNEIDSVDKQLVIGPRITISGEVSGCEKLVVEGKVDITLKDVKSLDVGTQGTFMGTAIVETAYIAGTFEGTLKVSGYLDVGPNAVIKGTVSYGTIAVASGGKLLGTIESA